MSNSLEKETLEEEEEDIDDLLEDYELHRDRRHNIHHIVKEEEKHGRKSDTSSLKEMFKSHIGDFPQHSANGIISLQQQKLIYKNSWNKRPF